MVYVERQKEHHRQGARIPVLERSEGMGVRMVRDICAEYVLEQDSRGREHDGLEPGRPA